MLQRMAGNHDDKALKVLASVVQPPEGYEREGLREYDYYVPLNRLVDAVPPESDRGREFRELASRIAAGTATPAEVKQARAWLTLWRDNDAQLQPLLTQSELTTELVPVSQDLAKTALIGLSALDALENHAPLSATAKAQALETLKALKAPKAVLLNAALPAVETLVNAHNP